MKQTGATMHVRGPEGKILGPWFLCLITNDQTNLGHIEVGKLEASTLIFDPWVFTIRQMELYGTETRSSTTKPPFFLEVDTAANNDEW